MDQNDPARRQYDPYASQSTSQAAQYSNPGSVERFLQSSFLQQSPNSAPSSARAESSGAGTRTGHGSDSQQQQQDPLYGFSGYGGVSSLQQYSSDVGASAPSRASQAQLPLPQPTQQQASQTSLYPSSYGSSVMYGMAQTQTQQSPYDHVSQFRSRPAAAAPDPLSSQFAASQGQYYLPSHAMPTAGTNSSDFTAPQLSSQYHPSSGYQQAGPSPPTTYSAAMLGSSSQSGAYPSYTTPQPAAYNTTGSSQSIDQAFNEYQSRVRSIFTSVRDGTLRDIVVQLLNISHYLLGNAEALGLTRDDDALHDDRVRLWDEFNRAWLTTLQRQFDLTQEMMQSNQPVREPQSIMTQQSLEHLSRELVRMCDSVEKHGLVDYQMGVAEEEIMDLLLRCLQILDPPPPNDRSSDSGTAGTGEASTERQMV